MEERDALLKIFKQWSGSDALTIVSLPPSGSARSYYRIQSAETSAIGVWHPDDNENRAFIEFSLHFKKLELPVPEIYHSNLPEHVYLQQDLGDTTLFSLLTDQTKESVCNDYLKESLSQLSDLQVRGHKGLDYSKAYPRKSFDSQSMRWDLNYFKYHFLKLTGLVFDEQKLENDFKTIIRTLQRAPRKHFLFRDFQSRNIMIHDKHAWFIDFQGGRKGYPAYDVASLLYDAKANLHPDIREELLQHYLNNLPQRSGIERAEFETLYPGFVLIRKLQAMGAFGFRGIFEKKTHFLQSIPYALQNGQWIMENLSFPFEIPELRRILLALPDSSFFDRIQNEISQLSS